MDQTLKQEADFRLSSILVPLLAIIAGVFMVVLDSTAMNVALSRLVVDFKTDLHTLQWVVTGYMLARLPLFRCQAGCLTGSEPRRSS